MATAEHREPYESRGSRTCLGARGGEIPPRDSTFSTQPAEARMSNHVRSTPNTDRKFNALLPVAKCHKRL
jgi:hypothetical protein